METIYELPTWAETILIICIGIMLAGLALWISCKAIQEAVEAQIKLEQKRSKKEAKALSNWQILYEEEKAKRLQDVADLSFQNSELVVEVNELEKRIKAKDELLARKKVKDL